MSDLKAFLKQMKPTKTTLNLHIKILGGKEFIHLNRYSNLRTKVRNFELRGLGWIFVTCISMIGSLIIGKTAQKSIRSETLSINSISKKHQR